MLGFYVMAYLVTNYDCFYKYVPTYCINKSVQ